MTTIKVMAVLGVCLLFFGCGRPYERNAASETVQKDGQNFTLKLTAYPEKRDFAQALAGAYYVLEVRSKGNQNWKEILSVGHDDFIRLNPDCIRIVNDDIAYAFVGGKYAVITDGGETWKVWDGRRDESFGRGVGFKSIQEVEITEGGRGTMRLKLINEEQVDLITDNYGVSWSTRQTTASSPKRANLEKSSAMYRDAMDTTSSPVRAQVFNPFALN